MLKQTLRRHMPGSGLRHVVLISATAILLPCAACADVFLYTLNFGATAESAATSASFLTNYIAIPSLSGSTPPFATVLAPPGVGATLDPNGAATSNSQLGLAFDLNGNLTWLFDASVAAPITATGTYAFSSVDLSTALDPLNTYHPAGDVVVQQLTAPAYRYTETFAATQYSAAVSFSWDAPALLVGYLGESLYANQIDLLSLPTPSSSPTTGPDFYVGGNQALANFVDTRGNLYSYSATLSSFYTPGTYAFSSGTLDYNHTVVSDSGSLTVEALPEPAGIWLCLGAGLILAMRVRKRGRA